MKTRIASLLVIVILFSIAGTSCEKGETENISGKMLYDAGSKQSFRLDDQVELNEAARLLAKAPGEFTILENAAVVDLKDRKGNFKAISMTYQVDANVTRLIVPIAKKDGADYYVANACEMKCTTESSCPKGTHEVIERCAVQACTCNEGSGAASASVAFRD